MIVLASASPRRQELLKTAGIQFVVKPANIPEVPLPGESARPFAGRMAREKARVVWEQINRSVELSKAKNTTTEDTESYRDTSQRAMCVLGADTVVVIEEQILGKPESEEDAARMLRLLSGRKHQVITGVCLITATFEDIRSETTAVHFSEMPESEIRDYIASGEPMDKAGAYAIQGGASRWVLKIEGDYSNVVGLPVELVLGMLREHELP